MVDFREIRIGNSLLNTAGIPCAVGGLTPNWITLNRVEKSGVVIENRQLTYDEVFSISITAEVLETCGFTKKPDGMYWKGIYSISISEKNWIYLYRKLDDNTINMIANVQNVHQLQNLYFSITGKELTL